MALSVAILAGGRSSRMGTDKAFVPVGGRPIIEWIVAQVSALGDETILITNRPADYAHLGLPMFQDVLPNHGALGGLYSALARAHNPHVLCVACDMPFAERALLDHLIQLRGEADVVMPRLGGEAEPFRAVYARAACLSPMRAALEAKRWRANSFLPDVRVRFVEDVELDQFDPQRISFFNVNTPADLAQANALAEGRA
jgi:molybdopterin-guanine dinucleotide biosynthesis protein A